MNAKPLSLLVVFAAAIAVTGAFADPVATWSAVLLAGFYVTGIALGSAFFIAVHDVSGATWMERLRPSAQTVTRLLPLGMVLLVAARLFGAGALYPAPFGSFQRMWFQPPFAIARVLLYGLLWWIAVRRLRGAAYIVVFAITVSLASTDFIMALEPRFSSTMAGVYHFAGMFAAAIAAIIVVALRDLELTRDERHDLGKLLFAFSTFWMYIWFSQYMLIWYGNLADETPYFVLRTTGAWGVLMVVNVLINWVTPFLILLSAATKKNGVILGRVAVAVLLGHAVDLFVAIVPAHASAPRLSPFALSVFLGTLAAAALSLLREKRVERIGEPLVLAEGVVQHR